MVSSDRHRTSTALIPKGLGSKQLAVAAARCLRALRMTNRCNAPLMPWNDAEDGGARAHRASAPFLIDMAHLGLAREADQ